jgi:hypothetical protein
MFLLIDMEERKYYAIKMNTTISFLFRAPDEFRLQFISKEKYISFRSFLTLFQTGQWPNFLFLPHFSEKISHKYENTCKFRNYVVKNKFRVG